MDTRNVTPAAIDGAFSPTAAAFWSSTTNEGSRAMAYIVVFTEGWTTYYDKLAVTVAVRCVRLAP